MRTKVEPEEKCSQMEPKGWRDRAQPMASKSVAQTGQCLTKAEPEGRGSQVEP